MTIVGFAPDVIAATKIGIDFFKQALGDEGLDHFVRRTALEPGWQGQRQQGRSLGSGAENNKLGIGELGHCWLAPSGLSEPAGIVGCNDPEPQVTREAKERMVSAPR
jgi:hypothetical protein